MDELVYCEPKEVKTTKLSDITDKQVVICKCTGQEKVTFVDEDKVPSYSGEIKSPLKIVFTSPRNDNNNIPITDSQIRNWVRNSCEYHKIPYVLLALILQNENYPMTTNWRKLAQFTERSITTYTNMLDEQLFDVIPDVISKGSSGIANVGDKALKTGVKHSIENYARPPIPTSIVKDIFGNNTDSRISGLDWRNDLYYAAAYLRYLIDTKIGICYNGSLTKEQLYLILRAYNGPGSASIEYADRAINNLDNAIGGVDVLYFYEK